MADSREKQNTSIVWSGYEYDHHEKSNDWFWALGIIAVAGSLTALLVGNGLFALLIIVAAFVLGMYAAREPEEVEFQLTGRGLHVGDRFLPFEEIESFWVENIDDDDVPDVLFIASSRLLMPILSIPLDTTDPEAVRRHLLRFVPEERHEEPLAQRIMEFFGF